MDFDWTQPIPTDPARQSVGLPTESIGLDQIPLCVWSKSSGVILKQKSVGLARLASLLDFHWTSKKRQNMTSAQSTGLPMDF